jgi:hypothetical protein
MQDRDHDNKKQGKTIRKQYVGCNVVKMKCFQLRSINYPKVCRFGDLFKTLIKE